MRHDSDPTERTDSLKQVTEVLGAIASIAALVYVAGGAIYFVRLSRYGVEGLTVVSGLPREFLISVGLVGLAGPWFVGGCLYLLAGFWWKAGAHSLIPGVALPVALAIAGAWVGLSSDGRWSATLGWCLAVAALVFFALWATVIRVNQVLAKQVADPRTYLRRPGTLFIRAALHGLAFVPAGLTLAAGLPLQRAEVCPAAPAISEPAAGTSADPLQGRYLGESGDRVWLALDTSGRAGEAQIAAVPWSGASRVYIYAPSQAAPTC
jgi:hypothetical protein